MIPILISYLRYYAFVDLSLSGTNKRHTNIYYYTGTLKSDIHCLSVVAMPL